MTLTAIALAEVPEMIGFNREYGKSFIRGVVSNH